MTTSAAAPSPPPFVLFVQANDQRNKTGDAQIDVLTKKMPGRVG